METEVIESELFGFGKAEEEVDTEVVEQPKEVSVEQVLGEEAEQEEEMQPEVDPKVVIPPPPFLQRMTREKKRQEEQ